MIRPKKQKKFSDSGLEIKCLILYGISQLVVITITFFLIWKSTKDLIDTQNPRTGRVLADQVLLVKHWEVFNIANKEEYFLPLVLDTAAKLSQKSFDHKVIKPDTPSDQLDEFERQMMEKFTGPIPPQFQTPVPTAAVVSPAPESGALAPDGNTASTNNGNGLNGSPMPAPSETVQNYPVPDYVSRITGSTYEYYQAIRARRSCITSFCHPSSPSPETPAMMTTGITSPGLPMPEGTLMAVIRVTIPTAGTQKLINRSWNILLCVGVISTCLGIIGFYITIRKVIIKPLHHLRDVSDAVFHGDISLRAELNTGDEFELLANAFNRMLRHLVDSQSKLRNAYNFLEHQVDQQAELNMRLYELNRIKSEFLAQMSHELRTPLNSILGFSDVLVGIDSLNAKQKRYVENIQVSGRLLLTMINDILDLAKMESGKMEVNLLEFPIERIVGAQCDMARPLAEKKNIALIEDIPPGLPTVIQDQNRLMQILNNLLSNAIKFTPEGGAVQVTVERDEPNNILILSVSDTGVGIADEDQQIIFEKFRQGASKAMESVMTREHSGTGLGLSIVKEICKLLQGEVSVSSRIGVGSTFTIRVPWRLDKLPKLDSPLLSDLEAFSKTSFDHRPPSSE